MAPAVFAVFYRKLSAADHPCAAAMLDCRRRGEGKNSETTADTCRLVRSPAKMKGSGVACWVQWRVTKKLVMMSNISLLK
jgi:hypothetical protein